MPAVAVERHAAVVERAPLAWCFARYGRRIVAADQPHGLLGGIAIRAPAERLVQDPGAQPAHPRAGTDPLFPAIDFNETDEAMRNHIKLRRRALDALRAGETIVILPAAASRPHR